MNNKFSAMFVMMVVMILVFPQAVNSNVESYQFSDYSQFVSVDMYKGDVGANIPLFSVPGRGGLDFPISLSYQTGIKLDQQASWVGLGWSINIPGVTRIVNGYPDDYKGNSVNINIPTVSDWDVFWNTLSHNLFFSTDIGQMFQQNVHTMGSIAQYAFFSGDLGVNVNFSGLDLSDGSNQVNVDGFFNIIKDDEFRDVVQTSDYYSCDEHIKACLGPYGGSSDFICAEKQISCTQDSDCITPLNGLTITDQGYDFQLEDDCSDENICRRIYANTGVGTTSYPSYECYDNYDGLLTNFKTWGIDKEQPDSYFISMMETGGKLVMDKSHLTGFSAVWKLQKTSNIVRSITPIFTENLLTGFLYKGLDGKKYYFTKKEMIQNTYSKSSTDKDVGNCGGDDDFLVMKNNDPYAYSWTIEKILSFDYVDDDGVDGPSDGDSGNWIKFDYVEYASDFLSRQPYDYSCERGPSGYSGKGHQVMTVSYLSQIETPTHKAVFNVDFNNREDGKESGGTRNSPKLTEIVLKAKQKVNGVNTESDITRYRFSYDYSLAQGAPDSDSGRLTLKYVTQLDPLAFDVLPGYQFEYAYGDEYSEPYFTDNSQNIPIINNLTHNPVWEKNMDDRWGYYAFKEDSGANSYGFEETWGWKLMGDVWSLTKINWPNGGSTELVYENDRYKKIGQTDTDGWNDGGLGWVPVIEDGDVHYGGGIRVNLVRNCNGIGNCVAERYLYLGETGYNPGYEDDGHGSGSHGLSSGVATVVPMHGGILDDDRNVKGSIHTTSYVGYGRVVRIPYYNEITQEAPFGYEVYKFATPNDYPNYGPNNGEKSMEHKRGQLKSVDYMIDNGYIRLFKTVNNKYSIVSTLNGFGDYLKSGRRNLIQQNQTLFFNHPVPAVNIPLFKTSVDYVYKSTNGLPMKITETNSDGSKRITKTKYAWELDRYATGSMMRKNMLSQVYETKVFENTDSPDNLVSMSRTNWTRFNNNWRPEYISVWKDENNDRTLQESELIKTQSFESYDQHGNLLVSRDASNIPSYFYYGNNGQCSNDGTDFGHSMVTCIENSMGHQIKNEYNSLYMIRTSTDPNEHVTQYGYDNFNRLRKVANPGSSLADPDMTYDYHFFETELNPAWVMITSKVDNSNEFVSKKFFDGMGRSIQSQTKNYGSWIVTNTEYYDKTSLVEKTYKPVIKNTYGEYDTTEPTGIFSRIVYENNPLMRIKEIYPINN
ncbi:hypothetical protein HQ529_03940 [Candidatus Woesearchaeota archaeon]|nr:hypothetical protein [Candidatus Woesearchaeota archaeon]